MNNSITVYQKNTLNISVQITETGSDILDLSGFTAIMDINTGASIISITGDTITSGNTSNFLISSEQNNLKPDVYQYEIYIYKNTDNYTVIKDSYTVLSSLIIPTQ